MEQWVTVKDVANIRNCSERNVIALINKGELKARKEGRRWMILIDTEEIDSAIDPNDPEMLSLLKVQLEHKDKQIEVLQKQLEEMRQDSAEANQRHDTIVLQLSRQLEKSQLLLEHHQEPWYRRIFKKDKGEEKNNT